jgi:type I protein arginine methyltransferase
MYSISGYGQMITDDVRMTAYSTALRRSVKPGSVVLDIGTGPGILALLACQFGAGSVYAIEPDNAIEVARELAAVNGYADRIHFIQKLSTEVNLPAKADVVISDLRGVLPLFQTHLPSIIDARQRFLAPGGTLIPEHDVLWAAVVDAKELYTDLISAWDSPTLGLDLKPARKIVMNSWRKARFRPEQLVVEPRTWVTLDYPTVQTADFSGEISWNVDRPGTAHGLCVWFDTLLSETVSFSNAPGAPELIYGSAFLPWLDPVDLSPGDHITVFLQATLVGEDYSWSWNTQVLDGSSHPKADYRQSTFYGAPLSLARLRKQAHDHIPSLNGEGQIDQFILARMDDKTSLDEITQQLLVYFPSRFSRWQDALTRVGELSQKYSQ